MPSLLSASLGCCQSSCTPDELRRWQDSCSFENHNTSWQDGYYDTRVKTAKQFQFVTCYIEQNPVVKGLVKNLTNGLRAAQTERLVTDPWPWLLDEE